jgi:type II secretory pathway predicted ATPase ExeA
MKASENTPNLPPFPAFPCVSRYVPVGATADALDRVRRSIKSSDGVSLLIGPPGTGKSLICRIVAEEFSETHDVVLLGDAPIDDAADFHRHLLHRLNVDLDRVLDGDLHLALIDRVCGKQAAPQGLLVIVDEAQSLSADVLEAVRMVTNIMDQGQPRVTAVVCGGVKLDDTLTSPSLEPFTQRVSTRCYLHPLNASESRHYICEAIRSCESNPTDTITDEAIGAIHHACSGVPRLINQIMTEAIDCAAEHDQDCICEKMIDMAWAQLQQLPSPMTEEPKIVHNTAPVEFGTLSDLDSVEQSDHETEAQAVVESELQTQPTMPMPAGEQTEPEADSEVEVETLQTDDTETEVETSFLSSDSFRDVAPAAPLPTALFGEFEVEETIPLGNGVASTMASQPDHTTELESMIHSEIVSLSELAEDARMGCIEAETEEIIRLQSECQPPAWTDEPVRQATPMPGFESDDIILSTNADADDSDMLVIEEDIDVDPQPQVTRVDPRDKTITVDFHAMLNSMRKST